ncbi:MAG TPA: putative Ig domain-containing protein [Candidatus Acidoferrum sp.]|nr:putative Ig domain-containing protein [Candidatus Acidoferrum sp.]
MKKLSRHLIPHLFAFTMFLLVPVALFQGCGSSSGNPTPTPVAISTTSLPGGQVGTAYSATLVATGGTIPLTWTLTSGTLPANLQLNAATGAITGTPTTAANNLALTFQVKDSGSPQQSKSVDLTLTIAAPTLAISTTTLSNGVVGVAYNQTLVATGGTTPYTWTLTSGALPTNLQLNAATGAITGTPTVTVTNTALTFQVKDSGNPQQTKTVNLSLTIGSAVTITVSLSPKRGGLAVTQSLGFTATTNDPQGVTWSASAGTFSASNATTATYVAPGAAGTVTVTATSATNGVTSASATIGVTDLAGVLTYHNDLARDGVNAKEYALTPTNVATATFGKLFSCTADAAIYTQPLWVPNLTINGGKHNVIFAATVHDTVYAFDADTGPCVTYWNKSLLGAGETFLSHSDVGSSDIFPDIGIIGTPVIDASTNTLYVVSKSKTNGTSCSPAASCFQRLHALSLIDGTEKFGGPANITSAISVPGTGDGSSGGNVAFNTLRQNQRPGLALLNGVVYVAWASHGDQTPYHGWVIGFDKTSLAPVATFNANPNGSFGGIWMSGGAPAADALGNLYFLTGNGTFDANTGGSDYGDSTVKLSTAAGLSVTSYFTPADQSNLNGNDTDHGSGGAAILVDLGAGAPHPRLLIGGGKEGNFFLLDRDNLGGYGANFTPADSNAVQKFPAASGIFSTAAFFNNGLYIAPAGASLEVFAFNPVTGLFNPAPTSQSPTSFGFPGATPSVSAAGMSNAIVWAMNSNAYGSNNGGARAAGPTVLHAYNATNLMTELWNSSMAPSNRDTAGNSVKFTVPTVANGKVYIGTRGNDSTTGTGTIFGEIDVYGLLPN